MAKTAVPSVVVGMVGLIIIIIIIKYTLIAATSVQRTPYLLKKHHVYIAEQFYMLS